MKKKKHTDFKQTLVKYWPSPLEHLIPLRHCVATPRYAERYCEPQYTQRSEVLPTSWFPKLGCVMREGIFHGRYNSLFDCSIDICCVLRQYGHNQLRGCLVRLLEAYFAKVEQVLADVALPVEVVNMSGCL